MSTGEEFDPREAFSRNIGWITPAEAEALAGVRVAIAGLGGVGGSHLLTLTRLGIGAFTLADPDAFELANFNRQAVATLDTLGRNKAEAAAEAALRINPRLDLRVIPEAVGKDNVEAFLEGADLYLDGLDFFAFEARELVFARCAERAIPAVTAAPLGMGTALLTFLPGAMTFEEYFGLAGRSEEEKILRFLVGLAPAMLHRGYVVWPQAVDLAAHRGPSTPMAVELCAGLAATEVLKILLGRGPVRPAPWSLQFDAYRCRMVRTWRPGGHRNPLTRATLAVARRQLARMRKEARVAGPQAPARKELLDTPAGRVLDLARWAPSGDNSQPWRFRIHDSRRIEVLGRVETEEENPYEYNSGQPTWLAFGCLLEAIRLAAAREGLEASWRVEPDIREPRFLVELVPGTPSAEEAALARLLPRRSVDRGPYRLRRLAPEHRKALEGVVGGAVELRWYETLPERWRWARAVMLSTKARLLAPECHEIHRRIIDFEQLQSAEGIPARAVGLDPLAVAIMRWAFRNPRRVLFMNRYAGGTWIPRLEMDLIPVLCSASLFTLAIPIREAGPPRPEAVFEAGRAVLRIWLTAEALGLRVQPLLAPLAFAAYGRQDAPFSRSHPARRAARALAQRIDAILPSPSEEVVFLARIGYPAGHRSGARSVRRPLEELLLSG